MPKRAPIALVPPLATQPGAPAKSSVAKARQGCRLVGAHVPLAVWRELHMLRGELGVTMQALMVEAIEDVVAKHRR